MTIGFGDMDIFVSNINDLEDILSINNTCKSLPRIEAFVIIIIILFSQQMSYRSSWLNMLLFGNFIHIVGYMVLAAWISSCLDKFGVRKF